jgi:hypothetical protein
MVPFRSFAIIASSDDSTMAARRSAIRSREAVSASRRRETVATSASRTRAATVTVVSVAIAIQNLAEL